MSILCPMCGMTVEDGSKECPFCGATLEERTQTYVLVDGMPAAVKQPCAETRIPRYYSLFICKGPQSNIRFDLLNSSCSIGRGTNCDIFLNHVTVSRKHSIITIEKGKMSVSDNGSTNGTWVNGKIVNEAELRDGDMLQIGAFVLKVEAQY